MPDFGDAAMNIGCWLTKPMGRKSRGTWIGRLAGTPGAPASAVKVEAAANESV